MRISFWPQWALVCLLTMLGALSGCGGGAGTPASPGNGLPVSEGGDGSGGGGGGGSSGGGGNTGPLFMGRDKVLIGAQMADATETRAPFDTRYLYLTSATPADPQTCMRTCSEACGGWWGCWQWHALPPGQYVTDHINRTTSVTWPGVQRSRIPMFTYYVFLPASGAREGAEEVAAMNDTAVMTRYLDDWRFLLQKVGDRAVMLHVEPDLWGFVKSVNNDPRAVPAQVRRANPTDCADNEDNAAGLARCMIRMVRRYAPNATVGLHASPWNFKASGNAQETAQYMRALGADTGDFIASDPADRDAGWRQHRMGENWHWWSEADGLAYLDWSKTLAETVGKPTVIWQIPLGNMGLNNTDNHWQDNRVDFFFGHMDAVAQSHVVALLFGAGHQEQTSPETDGDNLINRTRAYFQAGGARLH